EFADPALEQAVRQELGLQTGEITAPAALSLRQLVAPGLGIGDLSGIELLGNLAEVSLAYNEIVDLGPLAGLTGLERLDLEGNRVADLSPLAGLAALQVLILTGNLVEDVSPLLALPALRQVELWDNPLGEEARRAHVPLLRARGVEVGAAVEEPAEGPGQPEPIWEHLPYPSFRLVYPEMAAMIDDPWLGQSDAYVTSVAVSPADPGLAYLCANGTVWRSRDGAVRWEAAPLLEPASRVLADPVDVATVYAGEDPVFWLDPSLAAGRAHRSRDGGDTWEPLAVPGSLAHVDPVRSGLLYAQERHYDSESQSGWQTLSISRDQGASWEELGAVDKSWGQSFAWAHPADPSLRYAGITGYWDQGQRTDLLLRSRDNGATWAPVDVSPIPGPIGPDPASPGSLHSVDSRFFWHSGDEGATWTRGQRVTVVGLSAFSYHPAEPQWMWASSGSGLWESRDGGATWGLSGLRGTLIPHPRDARRAFRIKPRPTDSLLVETRDGGQTWEKVAVDTCLRATALTLAGDGRLYAAYLTEGYPLFAVTAPGGSPWTARLTYYRPGWGGWYALVNVNPHDPAVFLAFEWGTGYLRGTGTAGGEYAVVLPASAPGTQIGVHPEVVACGPQGRTYYAVDPTNASLHRSTDAALTWTPLRGQVADVAVHPDRPERLCVSSPGASGVSWSPDGGGTWQDLGPVHPTDPVVELAADPADPERLWAVTEAGLHTSGDWGMHWEQVCALPRVQTPFRVRLAVHPRRAGVLYLLRGGELLGSTDGGGAWVSLGELPEGVAAIADVALDPAAPDTLYAASPRGVYRLRWSLGATAVTEGLFSASLPASCRLLPSHPNPFNAATTLVYEVATPGRVLLEVYAATGQRVRVLVDGPRPPGRHACTWDGRDEDGTPAASGVYVAWLRTGGGRQARRLALVR
ncbi:MAG: leucine-rich repeat domain-containing protein, partial [Candidatus Latescibacterota bacterium]